MRNKLTLLIAALIIIFGACYVMHSKVIEVGEHIDTVHDEPYVYEYTEHCPDDCSCLECHDVETTRSQIESLQFLDRAEFVRQLKIREILWSEEVQR